MFKWIFSSVLPNFVRKEFFDQVELFMVDGDPQQGSEVAIAINMYMKNAFDGRCSHHIIMQGWKRRVPGCKSVFDEVRDEFKMVEHRIKSWLYLFTKPGFVEDKDEFEFSKKLLFSYLKSPIVAKGFGYNEYNIRTVSGFVTNYILIYAESIVFFQEEDKTVL